MRFTVAELRKNIRVALNAVERGEDVYITRHNKTFAIIKSPVSFLSTGEASINIRPDIRRESTPKGKNPFVEAGKKNNRLATPTLDTIEAMPHLPTDGVPPLGSDELSCCLRTKPCQHWTFDGTREVWTNSLSGRERGVV